MNQDGFLIKFLSFFLRNHFKELASTRKHNVMRKLLFFISICSVFISCSDDDNGNEKAEVNLVGTWQLTAIYSDPGDGSGDFVPVNSSKTVTFEANGDISSNADLCVLFAEVGLASTGTYSEEDNTISIDECQNQPVSLFYEFTEDTVILSYFCFEACQERYQKLEEGSIE